MVIQRDVFLSYPHTNNGFFLLLTTVFYLKISFQKSMNTLIYNFTWCRHFNIAMTSLDKHVREFQYNQCMYPSHDSLGKIAWVRWDFLSQGKISDICIRCARIPVTLPILLSAVASLFKQFGPRSGPTNCWAWSGSKLFDTLMVFLKEFF